MTATEERIENKGTTEWTATTESELYEELTCNDPYYHVILRRAVGFILIFEIRIFSLHNVYMMIYAILEYSVLEDCLDTQSSSINVIKYH